MPDGLLSRYTRQLKAANVGETTRFPDDDRTRRARPRPHPRSLGVLILHQGEESECAFEAHTDRMTIGRSRESDIAIEDASVSRLHAVVARDEEGTYRICDQDSVNGTFVNGQPIFEQVLEDGDEIQVGMTVLAFRQL